MIGATPHRSTLRPTSTLGTNSHGLHHPELRPIPTVSTLTANLPLCCAQCCLSTWSTFRAAPRCRMRRAPASAAARRGCCLRGRARWTRTCCWPRCGRGRALISRRTASRVRGEILGLRRLVHVGMCRGYKNVRRMLRSGHGLLNWPAPGDLLQGSGARGQIWSGELSGNADGAG